MCDMIGPNSLARAAASGFIKIANRRPMTLLLEQANAPPRGVRTPGSLLKPELS
jgi:hypothetical protein